MKKPVLFPYLRRAAQATGLAAEQSSHLFRRAVAAALAAVQDVLRTEVENGNAQTVKDFLTDKALPTVRALLLERMAARLLLRLGMRGALATNVIGWVLPFVLEQMVRVGHKTGFFAKIKTNATVAETLARLEELQQAVWKRLAPDAGTSAEVLPDDMPLPRQLPAAPSA